MFFIKKRKIAILIVIVFFVVGCTDRSRKIVSEPSSNTLPQCEITVDGDLRDWQGVPVNVASQKDHLRTSIRSHLDPETWEGRNDLSFKWRGAWRGDYLFFAFEVNDDCVTRSEEKFSYECDCVEICMDYANQGGRRVKIMDGRDDWSAKCDARELMGYEIHFLAAESPEIFLDHKNKYNLNQPQTMCFQKDWCGKAVFQKTEKGYLLEIGFKKPSLKLFEGKVIGFEMAVCDNDGAGRDNVMTWTGMKTDYWLIMDDYIKCTLTGPLKNR